MPALVYGTTYASEELTDFITGAYVSLHTADPGATGANEVTGGSYARQACAMTVTGKTADNDADEVWTSMPAGTITHIGFWTASTAGTFRGGGALNASATVAAGNDLRMAAGTISITLP